MKLPGGFASGWIWRAWLAGALVALLRCHAAGADSKAERSLLMQSDQQGWLKEKEGIVWFQAGTAAEIPARAGQPLKFGESLQTEALAGALVKLDDESQIRMRYLTRLEFRRPEPISAAISGGATTSAKTVVRLSTGELRVSSRGGAVSVPVETKLAKASPRGTEYTIAFDPESGRTEVAMFDGTVLLENEFGSVTVTNGWRAVAEPGGAPQRARISTVKIVQWWLDYPGVLDVEEAGLTPKEQATLADSLRAYRQGDLVHALENYPAYPHPAEPQTDAQRIYLAALLLGAGAVDAAENQLSKVTSNLPAAHALRMMISAVTPDVGDGHGADIRSKKGDTHIAAAAATTASEWLAASYLHQSTRDLKLALDCARRAVEKSPRFGFGWARVAELEFSFGRIAEAKAVLEQALELSPRNAEAHALKGFVLAAENRITQALAAFDTAIELDSGLSTAWLGRGLCKRRIGRADWLDDLQTAAGLEPSRALLRSYLGKAFGDVGDERLAQKELAFALVTDPNDPTGWLYSALLKQQQNQINQAITDLEKSSDLNDNRALFRSRLLLDQDRAVRSANLASVYRDAGMWETSLREAAQAVTYDYANDSAHLFISDSFNEMRDPTRFNLRYETVWFSELLLANLLAPVGAGRLSQTVTAQEYSKLFESDGLGIANDTLARSDGQVWERASQFGTFRDTAWALDFDYQHNNGVRPNNDLDRFEWYSNFKQQLTPTDTVLVLVKYENYSSGDNFQYYGPTTSYRPNFRFDEHQDPIVIGGYQHEWSPGIRTLLLGGRLVNEQKFSDVQAPQLLLFEGPNGDVNLAYNRNMDLQVSDDLEIYTASLAQVYQRERFSLVAGALWQGGDFHFANALTNSGYSTDLLTPVDASFSEPFNRVTGYGYLTIEPIEKLWLIGGASYDHLEMPVNFRSPPQSVGTEERELVGPKAAFVWRPLPAATLRGIYAQSLGGVSLDESFRLEPTQLAGFPQAFRTVISESKVGSVAAPEYEVMGLALGLKLGRQTYAGLEFDRIVSGVEQTIGAFRNTNSTLPFRPSTTSQNLDYEENSFSASVNQLLGDRFAVGLNYRFARADLKRTLPEVPVNQLGATSDDLSSLNQLGGYVLFNDPSGFFARFDARWYRQSNNNPNQPGDSVVQLDLWAGYRFWRRQAELSVGLLNLADQDYHLNPLTLYSELPRERVLAARAVFRF